MAVNYCVASNHDIVLLIKRKPIDDKMGTKTNC